MPTLVVVDVSSLPPESAESRPHGQLQFRAGDGEGGCALSGGVGRGDSVALRGAIQRGKKSAARIIAVVCCLLLRPLSVSLLCHHDAAGCVAVSAHCTQLPCHCERLVYVALQTGALQFLQFMESNCGQEPIAICRCCSGSPSMASRQLLSTEGFTSDPKDLRDRVCASAFWDLPRLPTQSVERAATDVAAVVHSCLSLADQRFPGDPIQVLFPVCGMVKLGASGLVGYM